MTTPLVCSLDCSCSYYEAVLAIDTSHLCSLGRLASCSADCSHAFGALLAAHTCAAARKLITSSTMMGLEMDLSNADCPIRTYAPTVSVTALESIVSRETLDSTVTALRARQCTSPDGQLVPLNERDATLVAAAEDELTQNPESGVVIVSDDERLLLWLDEMRQSGHVASISFHVLHLLVRMVACGALSASDFLDSAEAEAAHYESLAPDRWIRSRKQTRLDKFVNAVAAMEEPA